jgi:hypothetical protein
MHIYQKQSTNGRWGVQVLCPSEEVSVKFSCHAPVRGKFVSLGETGGFECFKLEEGGDFYACVTGDAQVIQGGVVVYECSLQSSDHISLLHLNEGAVVKIYGYKRRDCNFYTVKDGHFVSLPPIVLLNLGLIESKKKEAPMPPVVESGFAIALKNAMENLGQ